ncbi:hypothetical protein JT358_08930 [Micrococcales bacterium 31B]|nr:hypothetical protein [Micrococcales bacterium 31B]
MSDYTRYCALSAGAGIGYWVITWFAMGLHAGGLLWLGVACLIALFAFEVLRGPALVPHRFDHLTCKRRRLVRATQVVSIVTLVSAAALHGTSLLAYLAGTFSISGSIEQMGAVLAVPVVLVNALANASLLLSTQRSGGLLTV